MEILLFMVGGARVAVSASQVARVGAWPADLGIPVRPLSTALGCEDDAASCSRVLVCSERIGGGFAIASSPVQCTAEAGSVFTVPLLLRRWGAPSWLAGLASLDGALALFVDLEKLVSA